MLILVFLLIFLETDSVFGEVLLLKQFGDSSKEKVSKQVELILSEWFFEKGIFALSEQNSYSEVSLELALYATNQVNAKMLVFWNVDNHHVSFSIYSNDGNNLAEEKFSLGLMDGNLEHKLTQVISHILEEAVVRIGLLE